MCERYPSVSQNILGLLLSVKVSRPKFILLWAVNLSFYPAGLLNWAKMSFMYTYKYEIALRFLIPKGIPPNSNKTLWSCSLSWCSSDFFWHQEPRNILSSTVCIVILILYFLFCYPLKRSYFLWCTSFFSWMVKNFVKSERKNSSFPAFRKKKQKLLFSFEENTTHSQEISLYVCLEFLLI